MCVGTLPHGFDRDIIKFLANLMSCYRFNYCLFKVKVNELFAANSDTLADPL